MPHSTDLEKKFAAKNPLYDRHEALVEAWRCLQCHDAPCIQACPTGIEVPRFIKAIAEDQPLRSAKIIMSSNVLGYSCACVCPVEELCAGACVLHHKNEAPIAIGRLQHFACDHALATSSAQTVLGKKSAPTGKRVACIGAGAASIALATLLCQQGHHVEIFEKRPISGGLNAWGVAPYKLRFDDALREMRWLNDMGVVYHENSPIESKARADQLFAGFDAIFLGIGIGDDKLDNTIPNHPRIMGATDFIGRMKTDHTFSIDGIRRAHVIGGGNTAIDAAHELLLLGVPEVNLVYRKSKSNMSAYRHETESALADGLRILENRSLTGVTVEAEGTALQIRLSSNSGEETIEMNSDLLLFAIGQDKNMAAVSYFDGVQIGANGIIEIDPLTFRTGNPRVWAGGDCVNGGKEVVNAVAEAKIAAHSMHDYLINQKTRTSHA